jgi:cell volume regulation protein A
LLASIISSTDAAAVFAVLRSRSMNVRERVAATLEVESGSNDPMAVIMTIACIELVMGRIEAGPGLVWLFAKQLGLGALIGWGVGRLANFALTHIRLDVVGLYSVLASALGLLAFGTAAILGGSGFLAVYIAGIVIGSRRVPFKSGVFVFHDGMAWLAQIAMFVVLGLLSFPSRLIAAAGPALLVSAVLILAARPAAVWLCLLPFRFSWREMAFIAAGGLKGAVPIVLGMYPLLAGLPGATDVFDVVFFAVLVSAVTQGWTLPWLGRLFRVSEAPTSTPPVVLEISSLRDVDGDIVEYAVTPDSRASRRRVRDLALPDGALVAMIVRGSELIPPRGSTLIEPDDHVFVLTRPGLRELVDRIFGGVGDMHGPVAMEFPLRGSSRVTDIEMLYGIQIATNGSQTLSEFMAERLGPASVGQTVRVGPVVLAARDIVDGRVVTVGLSIVDETGR